MNVWSYVITTDSGAAPNFDPPAATLAICKPRIRRNAQEGELVIAFNGRTLSSEPHSVRWAGIVSKVLWLADYWNDPRFARKKPSHSSTPDNIYRHEGGYWIQESNNIHNFNDLSRDCGGQNALVFDQYWYLGASDEPLEQEFGLRVASSCRRTEPKSIISHGQWMELEGWLSLRAKAPKKMNGSRRCKPCQQPTRPKPTRVSCGR